MGRGVSWDLREEDIGHGKPLMFRRLGLLICERSKVEVLDPVEYSHHRGRELLLGHCRGQETFTLQRFDIISNFYGRIVPLMPVLLKIQEPSLPLYYSRVPERASIREVSMNVRQRGKRTNKPLQDTLLLDFIGLFLACYIHIPEVECLCEHAGL